MGVVTCVAARCATAPSSSGPTVRAKHPVFVSTGGNDGATGSEATPFRTIEHALDVADGSPIVVDGGEYAEAGLKISRGVEIVAPKGNVTIGGRISVSANDVSLRSLDLAHGLTLEGARNLVLDTVHIKSGGDPDTLAVKGGSVQAHDLDVTCGAETCIQASSSTVSLTGTHLVGDAISKRGLRVDTSSLSASDLTVSGTSIDQVLAGHGADVHLSDVHAMDAQGTALAAIDGAHLLVDRASITGAAKFALLAESSRVQLRASSAAAPTGSAVGIAGGDVDIIDTTLETSAQGDVTISAHAGKSSSVRISGGLIHHGAYPGILLTQGDLLVSGTHFLGDPAAATDGGDAITANGLDATLSVRGAVIDAPAGYGIAFVNNSAGSITATITRARLGGVSIDGAAGAPVALKSSRIEACRQGSGVAVLDATDVTIAGTSIAGCPEAGVLGGQGATINVSNAIITNNAQYGLAAFGGSVIEVSGSRVKGSRWALYASCGDQARIEDAGGNTISGQTTSCH